MKYTRLLYLVFITISLKLHAQNTNRWFQWQQPASFPVKEGLGNAITGISNGALIIAGGSNFDKPILAGGKKLVHDKIYVATDLNVMNWQEAGRLPWPVS